MIHVATSHVHTDSWIQLQLDHLERNTSGPYRTWAIVDSEASPSGGFDWAGVAVGEERIRQSPSLNRLTAQILGEVDADDDVILFVHGDSLPIAPGWDEMVLDWLKEAPLVAVSRIENAGDPHPHECFCAATVGFWRESGVDWRKGPTWPSEAGGEHTDTGARLWRYVEDNGIEWKRLFRSPGYDLHPVFFAVYGDVVYHHGAAFRTPMSRADGAATKHLPAWRRKPALLRRRWRNARRSRRVHRRLMAGETVASALDSER